MKKYFILVLVLFAMGCSPRIEESRELLGTVVTISAYGAGSGDLQAAFSEMERIELLLSSYNNKSEVYRLNENSLIEDPSDELIYNIKQAVYFGNISNGAFDITVQPILDLYAESFREKGRAPSGKEIKETLILVDSKDILLMDNMILFRKEDMKITLGGIAKGYAIDRAIRLLENRGVTDALVNAGGDIRAIGTKPDQRWQVALQNPRDKNEFITIIPIADRAVATSGDYERYFDENKSFHHIVDPRTGYSATELMSVTIMADTAMEADAIATSVFVLGEEKGMELIESLDGVEGLLITEEREMIRSSGFP